MQRLRFRTPSPPPGLELDEEARREICERLRAQEAAQVEEITRRWEERERGRRYSRMGLDPSDADAPCNAGAADTLLAWLSQGGRGRNALLWGNVGAGKTSCAKRVLLRWPKGGFCLNEADMASALRSCFRGTGDVERYMEGWCRAPLLVLDDMGKACGAEGYRDWFASAVYELVDRRYTAALPIVVTAQVCATDLVAKLAEPGMQEAVYSRLFANAKTMHFTGPDRRAEDA